MEELSAMMYVNEYRRGDRYDVVVLDCAPTAESLRFVSMPTTLAWYMRHIFPIQRRVLKAVRPVANRVAPFELPPDAYFANVQQLFRRLEGVDTLLEDPAVTSVKLVTNPERVVLRETQRAFVYFSLHGLTVDTIIVNRMLPEGSTTSTSRRGTARTRKSCARSKSTSRRCRSSACRCFRDEVLGRARLEQLAHVPLRPRRGPGGGDADPAALHVREARRRRLRGARDPAFADKHDVGLFKKGEELIVEVGTLRRHIGLPTSMASLTPRRATLADGVLTVELEEGV